MANPLWQQYEDAIASALQTAFAGWSPEVTIVSGAAAELVAGRIRRFPSVGVAFEGYSGLQHLTSGPSRPVVSGWAIFSVMAFVQSAKSDESARSGSAGAYAMLETIRDALFGYSPIGKSPLWLTEEILSDGGAGRLVYEARYQVNVSLSS
jgi:Bacteriophage Mu, Gp37